jgi:hypothetical protein
MHAPQKKILKVECDPMNLLAEITQHMHGAVHGMIQGFVASFSQAFPLRRAY